MSASNQKVDQPAQNLQSLIQRGAGVYIPTETLRMFIRDHFDKLSALAHQIHDEEVGFAKEAIESNFQAALQKNSKLDAIKHYRELKSIGFKEAKQYVLDNWDKLRQDAFS